MADPAVETKDEAKEVKHDTIVGTDIDASGNVVIWDHGPHDEMPASALPPESDGYKAAKAQYDADHAEWHRVNGPGPVPLTMAAGDAGHAIYADPQRYAIEPLGDDAEVKAEVEEIRKRRETAKKHAETHAARVQLALDRKAAVATVMAKRRAKHAVEEREKLENKKGAAPAATGKPFAPFGGGAQ